MRFVAGRGAVAERLVRGTAVAERHREDVACCGTADAEPSGRLAGALLRRKAADNAKAPLRGKGAGREQELARGVRS